METLETSRLCRLCGKQSGILINIFDKNEIHVKKINAVLPIMVHEMDLLPKHMCHRCSYKLEEYYKFYAECLKTDGNLKSQLSWMRKDDTTERIGIPMVHIENLRIKVESPDYDSYELDPIVDNVNYINSMSSMTYVNGVQTNGIHDDITYAAYTRCGCCCDKKDQSHTVSTGYEESMSGCSRVNCAGTSSDGCRLQAVKKNLLAGDAFQNSQSCVNVPKNRTGLSSSTFHKDGVTEKALRSKVVTKGTIVRNLRPRRGSVNYVATRKKSIPNLSNSGKKSISPCKFDASEIKQEIPDQFGGRMLRPRNTAIDYIDTRKYIKSNHKNQKLEREEDTVKNYKVQDIPNGKLPTDELPELFDSKEVKLSIKQELLSDVEDTIKDELISLKTSSVPKIRRSTGELTQKDDSLSNTVVVQHDIMNYSMPDCTQLSNFSIDSKMQSLTNKKKKKLMREKIEYAPKFLRSQDIYLRNGKSRQLDDLQLSAKRLRKSIRTIAKGTTPGKNLLKSIAGTVERKKVPTIMKLIDRNIKHFCEECNTSFMNNELFKLHGCYH